MKRRHLILMAISAIFMLQVANADLVHQWNFSKKNVKKGKLIDKVGKLNGKIEGHKVFSEDAGFEYMEFDGSNDMVVVSDKIAKVGLPAEKISIEATIRIRKAAKWLAAMSALQDNGSYERGCGLGFHNKHFIFGIAAEKTKKMTYLPAEEGVELGKWYHIVGTYDGKVQKIYVNGKLINSSEEQKGKILYPAKGWLVLGAYKDDNECGVLSGSLQEIKIYDHALSEQEIKSGFNKKEKLIKLPAKINGPSQFVVAPYLQYATKNSIVVCWETKEKCDAKILYGEKTPLKKEITSKKFETMHTIVIDKLSPETNYFYQVVTTNKKGERTFSEVYSFQTVINDETAYAFGVVADTQDNPRVWGQISQKLWGERVNFVIHGGDIVGDGHKKTDWTDEFLAPAQPFMSRVPVYSILGNHEGDAHWYYEYMYAPEPEYYYTFTYGNAQYFMLDTDRDVDENSEIYKWLEKELAKSTATWKFVMHHHPIYTSDENDYGDTYKGKSTLGWPKLRPLIGLYQKYDIDMVFYGHIHDYERTWPLKDDKVNKEEGVIYVQVGGGGGGLENYAPTRSWFTAKVHRDHHYLYIAVHGKELNFQAFDWHGNLFDTMQIRK